MPRTGTRRAAAALALTALAVLFAPPHAGAAGGARSPAAAAGPVARLGSWLADLLGLGGGASAAGRPRYQSLSGRHGAGIDPNGKPQPSATLPAGTAPADAADHGSGIDPNG